MFEAASSAAVRRGTRALRAVLAGEGGALARRWAREMRQASGTRDYERAGRRRDDLAALARVSGSVAGRRVGPERRTAGTSR